MCGATTTTITTITAAATAKRIISLFIVLSYVDVVNSVAFKGYYVVMWCSGDKYWCGDAAWKWSRWRWCGDDGGYDAVVYGFVVVVL